jgi:hypothetical protein
MAAMPKVAEFDLVELREDFESAPAGATGGVLDIFDGDMAMVELTSQPSKPILDRIVVVPLDKLRVVEPAHRH